jgi:hypothetical protein
MNDKGLLRSPLALERFSSAHGDPLPLHCEISVVPRSLLAARDRDHFAVILVENLNKLVMNAIRYSRLLAGKPVAIHIQINLSAKEKIEDWWKNLGIDVPRVVLNSADGSIIRPPTVFIDGIRQRHEGSIVTLLLPVLSSSKWWHRFLHNHTARLIEKVFQGKTGS